MVAFFVKTIEKNHARHTALLLNEFGNQELLEQRSWRSQCSLNQDALLPVRHLPMFAVFVDEPSLCFRVVMGQKN